MPSDKPPRIRDGDDGLRRYDCPECKRLLFRYGPHLVGGPVWQKCRCGNEAEIYFNKGPS